MGAAPDWNVEGRDWPNREASRFVPASGIVFHVQVFGSGPPLLLLHGTGAATHSWRGLAPLLTPHFTLIAPDLPGHGFTTMPDRARLSLPGMAEAIGDLLKALDMKPAAVAGHSAGAAIAVRMTLDATIAPAGIVSLNGALMPFTGLAAIAFPALAKLLFLNPFAAPFLAKRAAAPDAVRRLITGTGSKLDTQGLDYYERLFRTERHMAATVGMMANWDLRALKDDLPKFKAPLTLVVGEKDTAVPAAVATDVAALVPQAQIVTLAGLGHLAHEEAPERVAPLIEQAFARQRETVP